MGESAFMKQSSPYGLSLSLLVALLVTAAASGCGGSKHIRMYSYAENLPPVHAIVILQPDFYFRGMESYQAYEKWMDLAHQLSDKTDLVVIGPDEVRVLVTGVVTSLSHETDVLTVLKRYGIKPQNTIALKVMLTESWQQVQSVISNKEKSRAGRAEFESELSFCADAFQVDTSHPVFSLTETVTLKLVHSPNESDARPAITSFAAANYDRLISVLKRDFDAAGRSTDPRGATVMENPLECKKYRYQTMPTLEESLAQKDEIEQDAALRGRVTYRFPTLERGLIRKLFKGGSGLLVAGAEACSALRPDDRILKADGLGLTREYQFSRAISAAVAAQRAVSLEVLRDGKTVTVEYRCSE